MKVDFSKAADNGFVLLTNNNGATLAVSVLEFWEICRVGSEIDTKGEVEEYLAQLPDINGHDLDRIRAFPALIDAITEKVIDDRIGAETGDQIYYAAEKCIKSHIAEIENKVKWFRLSDNKCVSVWYAPDKHDGDQFQMHLEEIGGNGEMGPGCEVLSDESYATNNISFNSLCETLSEICFDADITEDWESSSDFVKNIANEIFDAFGMDKSFALKENNAAPAPWREYCLTRAECDAWVEKMVSTIRGIGIDEGSGYYGLKSFEVNGEKLNLYCEVSREQTDGNVYFTVYYAVEFDEGDTIFSDWAHTEIDDIDELKKVVFEIASNDYVKDVENYLKRENSLENVIADAHDRATTGGDKEHGKETVEFDK